MDIADFSPVNLSTFGIHGFYIFLLLLLILTLLVRVIHK